MLRSGVCAVLVGLGLLAGCGGSDEPAVPDGVPAADVEIGRTIVAGFDAALVVVESDGSGAEILAGYEAVEADHGDAAEAQRDQGTTPCIAEANGWWWMVIGGIQQGQLTERPEGRANLILAAADNLPAVEASLDSCPTELQRAIGWGE